MKMQEMRARETISSSGKAAQTVTSLLTNRRNERAEHQRVLKLFETFDSTATSREYFVTAQSTGIEQAVVAPGITNPQQCQGYNVCIYDC